MATKQIKKLSDLQKITTATGDQMIPVVDASGNVNPIKLTDLAQVVAGLMPVGDTNKKGFIKGYIQTTEFKWYNIFSGSVNDYLYAIGEIDSFTNQAAAFICLDIGIYREDSSRIKIDKISKDDIHPIYGVAIKYIKTNSSLKLWVKGKCNLIILSKSESSFNIYNEEPPVDAIEVDLNS